MERKGGKKDWNRELGTGKGKRDEGVEQGDGGWKKERDMIQVRTQRDAL